MDDVKMLAIFVTIISILFVICIIWLANKIVKIEQKFNGKINKIDFELYKCENKTELNYIYRKAKILPYSSKIELDNSLGKEEYVFQVLDDGKAC